MGIQPAAQRHGMGLALFRAVGDRLGEANVLQGKAKLFLASDQAEEIKIGTQHLLAALQIYQQIGDRPGQANCLMTWAIWLTNHGQASQALPFGEEALEIAQLINPDHPVSKHIEQVVNRIRTLVNE